MPHYELILILDNLTPQLWNHVSHSAVVLDSSKDMTS